VSSTSVSRSRPRPAGVARVVERELSIYRRQWRSSLFSYFVGPVLFLGAMGLGLGALVDAGSGASSEIDRYLVFVVPGLLCATLMQTAATDSLWPVMGGFMWIKQFVAMTASPLTPTETCLGVLAWQAVRMSLSGACFLLVAAALGGVVSWWAPLALPAAVLGGLAVSSLVIAFTSGQESDSRFPLVIRFVIQPLFLFSGTFFPVDQLPSWIQPAVWLSPVWHAVELARAATTGVVGSGGVSGLVLHVVVLLAVLAVGTKVATQRFERRLAS